MRCAQTLEVGAYVLGALSPAERDAFERHLGECAVCREEVADLAVLPGLLGRIDAATAMAVARDGEEYSALPTELLAEAAEAPQATTTLTEVGRWAGPTVQAEDGDAQILAPTGEAASRWAGPTAVPDTAEPEAGSASGSGSNVVALLDAAARRRAAQKRRGRWGTVGISAAAACLALAVGLGAPQLLGEDTPTGPAMAAMTQLVATVPVTAELALQPITSGTRVLMHCTYEGSGNGRWSFHLVVTPKNGAPIEIGEWKAGHGDEITLAALTTLKPDEIARIEIRGNSGTPLLSLTF